MDGSQTPKTVIGDDVEITGTIKSAGDVQLAGTLNGDLNCNGRAVVSQSAKVKGNITADATSIEGQISGNITVKDRIELKSTARIQGDIRAKRLTVEDGVTFIGKAEVTPSGQPADQGAAPAQEASQQSDDAAESDAGEKGKGGFGRK